MTSTIFGLACLVSILAEPNPWETQRTEPILIKTRARPGTDVKEIWAEADVAAPVLDIQQTVTDIERFTTFMPYMTESRFVGDAGPDGARYTYARLDVPVLSPRDFIHKAWMDRDSRTDPEGIFQNHWGAVPKLLPEKPGVVRLKISEGSWRVSPNPDGKSHVIYQLCVDPGGAVPAFAANKANADGLTDTFKNIEREAQRRAAAKQSPPSDASVRR